MRGGSRIGTLDLRFAHGSPPATPRVRLTGRLLAGRLVVATAIAGFIDAQSEGLVALQSHPTVLTHSAAAAGSGGGH